MIRALIIDDELHSRETTKMLVNMLTTEIEIIGMGKDAIEGVQLIGELQPDLIFLDVQMPHISGIRMLDMIPAYRGEIIFITAFNQYAVDAFKKGAIHYLLKPLDPDDLQEAVNRITKGKTVTAKKTYGNFLSLSTRDGWVVIKKEDITRVESYKNYTTIISDTAKHTVSKTMKEVEATLPPDAFYRVHNTHIIHINAIDQILKSDGGNVMLKNGDLIPISKGRKKDFFDWVKENLDVV